MSNLEPYEPKGLRFHDDGRELLVVEVGPYAGWICARAGDGHWGKLREVTAEDRYKAIQANLDSFQGTIVANRKLAVKVEQLESQVQDITLLFALLLREHGRPFVVFDVDAARLPRLVLSSEYRPSIAGHEYRVEEIPVERENRDDDV